MSASKVNRLLIAVIIIIIICMVGASIYYVYSSKVLPSYDKWLGSIGVIGLIIAAFVGGYYTAEHTKTA